LPVVLVIFCLFWFGFSNNFPGVSPPRATPGVALAGMCPHRGRPGVLPCPG